MPPSLDFTKAVVDERACSHFLYDAAGIIARNPALIGFIKRLSLIDREKMLLDKGEQRLSVYTAVYIR